MAKTVLQRNCRLVLTLTYELCGEKIFEYCPVYSICIT